jgi:TolB-like protein
LLHPVNMPDLFLSYASDDRATVRHFADVLQREGFEVWWDLALNPGEAFDEAIERALEEARAVIVLWSKASVNSRWVRAEATQAQASQRLVPVIIEACKRPIMFELTHTVDLTGWAGDSNDPRWRSFVAGLRRSSGRESNPVRQAAVGGTAGAQPAPGGFSRLTHAIGAHKLALASVALLLVLGGTGAWWYHASHGGQAAAAGAAPAAVVAAGQITLAVLPFADMSSAHDQDYFADGLTEEILNQLAQIRDLRVTGRTSSFYFKGRNEDLRTIGEKLGVANLLEGSVRKAGDQLRITAQLIDGRSGTHLWSQTYDRSLTDVFKVQEEIATAVSGALSVTLDVGEMSRARGGTASIEAFDKYLHALQLGRNGGSARDGSTLLHQAVAIDPTFLLAWQEIAKFTWGTEQIYPEYVAMMQPQREEAERHIAALAPAWSGVLRARRLIDQHRWIEAEAAVNSALKSPPAPVGPCDFTSLATQLGRLGDWSECLQRTVATDPLDTQTSADLQVALDMTRHNDEAQAEYERFTELVGFDDRMESYALFRVLGRKDVDPHQVRALFDAHTGRSTIAFVKALRDKFDDPAGARAILRRTVADPSVRNTKNMVQLAYYADRFGDRDTVLAALRWLAIDRHPLDVSILWRDWHSGVRADPRFKELLRELKIADYFRARGNWGDFCKPTIGDDFECH